jgi:hypothetical protein
MDKNFVIAWLLDWLTYQLKDFIAVSRQMKRLFLSQKLLLTEGQESELAAHFKSVFQAFFPWPEPFFQKEK